MTSHRLQSISTQVAARTLSGVMPYYVVTEFPKSGGTWLSQMLSEALNIHHVRHQFPPLKRALLHMHSIDGRGLKNVTVIWRDGRDVMISWYYHCLFEQNHFNAELVASVRAQLGDRDYDNVYEHLPDFIEYAFTAARFPRFTWADFVRYWHDKNGVLYTRYEDLLLHPADELIRLSAAHHQGSVLDRNAAVQIAEHYSFQNQSGRKAGNEQKHHFLRKGIVGDWKNNFSQQACEVFDFYAGEEMRLLGYQSC